MQPFEIDTDYEGSVADISLDEDRLVIDISFEASDNGELDQDDQINEDERHSVVRWNGDADHETEELESPASPDPEVQVDSESNYTYYDDRHNDDDWRDGDINNNKENFKTEDNDEVDEYWEEKIEASSEEWDSDSEAIRDDDGELNQDDLNIDDDSNSEVIGYNDDDDESEGMSGTEDRDDVDENSEEEEIEACTEEPIECKVESELNWDSSDEEESEKVGRILKAARKKAKASPKKKDCSDGHLNLDKDAFGESTVTLHEERLNALDELLAAKNSLIRMIRKLERKRTMVEELLTDAELQHKRKQKYKEVVAEKQQDNSRAHRHSKRSKRKKRKK